MKLNRIILVAVVCAPLLAVAAPAPKSNSGLLRQEVKQNNIGISLQRVASQLDAVIAEYNRNGLEGDDVDTLRRFRGMLNQLTGAEVAGVVKQLKAAQIIGANPKRASENAIGAFSGQKQVIVSLKQIYLDWQLQQEFRLLSTRYELLAKTQHGNLQRAVELVTKSRGSNSYTNREDVKIDLRIQELDQVGINDEAKLLTALLEKLDKKFAGTEEHRAAKALAKVKADLQPALEGAATDLKGKAINVAPYKIVALKSAAGYEQNAHRSMIELVRLLAPERSKEETIRQAIEDIKNVMTDQKEVMAETKELKDAKVPDTESLERQQAELVFQTDLIRQDVKDVVPEAADELKQSRDNQQTVRSILSNTQAAPSTKALQAPEQQELALENLADAKDTLEEELKKMAENLQNPKGKLEQLKELAQKVAELRKAEEIIYVDSEKLEALAEPTPSQQAEAEAARQLAGKQASEAKQIASHLEQVLEKAPEEVKAAAEIAAKKAEEIASKLPELEERAKNGGTDVKAEVAKAADALMKAAEQAKTAQAKAQAEVKKAFAEAKKEFEKAAESIAEAKKKEGSERAHKTADKAEAWAKQAAKMAAKAETKPEMLEHMAKEIGKLLPELEEKAKQGGADVKPEVAKAAEALKIAAEQAKAAKEKARAAAEPALTQAQKEFEKAKQALAEAQQKAEDARNMNPEQRKGLQEQGKQQEKVKGDTKKAQQDATEVAPEVAGSIGQAARQMQKSEDKLAQAENAPAEQQAAIDALKKAEQQLADKIAELEKAAEDKKTLEALNEDIGKLIEEQQKTQLNTAKAAGREQVKAPKPTDLADLIAKGAEDLAREIPGIETKANAAGADASKEPLDDAEEFLKEAVGQAKEAAASEGGDQEQKLAQAAQSLEKAAQQLDEAAKKAAEAAEQTNNSGQKGAAEQAEEQAGQAAQEAKDLAKQARGESPEGPQQKELANQQGDLAKDTSKTQDQAQKAEAPQDAQEALGEAKKQMNEAQQQLNKPSALGARQPQQEALENLQEARESVKDKIKELAQQLDQPQGPSPEDLQRALEGAQKAQDAIGEALAEEPDESIDQYLAAAAADYLPALYELGNIYKKGRIGKQEPVKAESCYIRYVMGPDGEQEPESTIEAATWLAESYSKGYSEGTDKIKQDLGKAATYYNLALNEVPNNEVEKREGLAGKIDLLELPEEKQKQAEENAKDSKWKDKEKKRAEKVQLD